MAFLAGGYTVTYNASSLGQIEDGINIEQMLGGEPIRGDNFGDTIQDFVFRGGDVFVDLIMTEWNAAGALGAFWYWSTTWGKMDDGKIGTLATSLASALVLTKVAGPNASPTSLTANKAILAPGYPVRHLFAPRLRRVPLRLQLLPYPVSTVNQFFTTT